MNTVQPTQEKRSIRVKDFLDDFRSDINDADLMRKYHLSPLGLEKFYTMLLDRQILNPEDFRRRFEMQRQEEELAAETDESPSFIGPACLTAQENMFDLCPSCGVSAQEYMKRETDRHEGLSDSVTLRDIHADEPEESVVAVMAADPPAGPAESHVCPSCLIAQNMEFDECPECGVSVPQFLAAAGVAVPAKAKAKALTAPDEPMEASVQPLSPADLAGSVIEVMPMEEHGGEQATSWANDPEDLRTETANIDEFDMAFDGPIEIPLDEALAAEFLPEADLMIEKDENEDHIPSLSGFESEAPQSPASFLPDSSEEQPHVQGKHEPNACTGCEEPLSPSIRHIYDRSSSLKVLGLAGAVLAAAALGALLLTFFESYSAARVIMIYSTGLSMLLGAFLGGIGLFMLLFAKEKVFLCNSCGRVYPRL
ncbi:MAG: hypothetical protein V2B18_19415 [Pseudomonadota bacterium]